MEKEKHAREELLTVIDGREWVICETTLEAVRGIVHTGNFHIFSYIYLYSR